MKTRRFLFVITLIGITTLACLLLFRPDPITEVISVAVNPPTGTGSFTLTVTYTFYFGTDRDNEAITCYYVTSAGAMVPIGSVFPPATDPEETFFLDGTEILSLSASDPGVYTATCKSSTSQASAVFGVTGPPGQSQTEPTPTAQPQPTATQEQVAFTMYGTFNLTWPFVRGFSGEYTSGEIQINIDPKTGLATGSLRGSGSGTYVFSWDGYNQINNWNYSYTALNLTGSIDPLTGMLTLNGITDGKFDWAPTNCIFDRDPPDKCHILGQKQLSLKITGIVNLVNHTGSGIIDATAIPDFPILGEWQSAP